jgi:hypothetical protein
MLRAVRLLNLFHYYLIEPINLITILGLTRAPKTYGDPPELRIPLVDIR